MKDIKSLYNEALMNKSNRIIDAYSESLNYIIENNPYEYISNLEYIITSNIGVSTLESFINKYGLSIPVFENIMTILEKTIEKCEKRNLDSSVFKEAHNKLIDHYESNKECFHMFEFYDIENKQDYIKKYYSFNERAIQYRKLAPVMISLFNEAAIPDLLITAKNTKGLTHKKFIDYMIEKLSENKILCEWIYTVENNWKSFDDDYINHIYEYTLSKSVNDIKIKSYNMYRESVIMGENKLYEMTEEEKINITDLIAFKEYRFISNDNSGIKLDDIYEMYSLLPESEFKESDADIVQMLPGSYKESETTSNKTSGTSPDYIKKNHTMAKWGEEEDGKGSEHNMDNDNDLDDYKRPSVRTYDKVEDDSESDDSEENKPPNPSQSNSSNVNNYYYYSYQNSFNKHHKNIDDHSTHNTTNISNSYNKSNDLKKESSDDLLTEGMVDKLYSFAKKVKNKMSGFKTIANIQNLDSLENLSNNGKISSIYNNIPIAITESNYFNESFLDIFKRKTKLNEKQIESSIDNLRKKFKTDIIVVDAGDDIKFTGGALCQKIPADVIRTMKETKKYDKYFSGEEDLKHVIVVSPRILSKYTDIRTEKDLELVISHEYGHILTMDSLTVEDMQDYKVKAEILNTIIGISKISLKNIQPEALYFIYYQLKPEKIANEAMNIDPRELTRIMSGRYPDENKFNMIDYKTLLNLKIDTHSTFQPLEDLKMTLEIYRKVVKSKFVLSVIEKSLNRQIEAMERIVSKAKDIHEMFSLNIFDEEYYNEGIKDVFKKISSKISGMFKKLTLANLQNLSYEDKIIPTDTIPGTMLPKSLLMKESYDDISEDDNIESFNESAVENYLSKNDIKNIINKLRKKFNAEIYFSNSEILSVTGGALAIETTIETIESLIKGKKIYKLPIKALGDEGEFKRVILVSPKVLSKSMKSNNPRILELILSHEYGHILTFDQITVDDWFEYNIKRKLNSQIMVSLYPNNYNDLIPEYQYYIYHQLKPEKIANEAMNIDPKEVIKAAYGRDIKGPESLSKININEFINFKTSALYKKVYSDSMKGIKVNPKDRIASLEEVKSILKRVINDKSKLNDFILLYDELINEYKTESINEAVGDADDNKPDSDHPIKDTLMDIDREMTKHGQAAKKKIQDIQNVGKAAIKPFKRMNSWINNMINQWKDNDENKIKEKMADPRQRKNLYNGIKQAILGGSLLKAGLLLNPIFLFLALTKSINNKNNEFRLRNEMIGEIKAELEIIEEKIKDADRKGDNKAKYQLMRFRNEMKKKLLRVGGGKQWSKII